jgi:hypothetical protein
LAVDWAVADTPNKAWQNLASDLPLARDPKVEVSEVALADAVVASAEASGVIEVVSAETEVVSAESEVVSVESEVGMAEEVALATKVEAVLEAEEGSQTAHHHQMRQVDQAEREAVGTELALRMVRDPTMATVEVAMDTVLVVNETSVAARAAHPGSTAVEINVVG